FDPEARDNLAVYYGQSPATEVGGLLKLCNNPNVDIVILSFLFTFFTPDGYPSIDFGPGCTGPNARQQQQAPGLSNCTALAPEITGCQALGKKILVSLGGYVANTSFSSEAQTQQFSATLWGLFGPDTVEHPDLRPFGPDVVVDGFDIDNENHNTTFYNAFARSLREQYRTDPSKTYYLSAAPQCPLPDESIPLGAMLEADFVWVQFYNNPACDLDTDGFQNSFAAWSRSLTDASARDNPRVYIGTGAWEGAGKGYVQGSGLATAVGKATALNVSNMGGMMLWDGSQALQN
ncbi:glycoside hydrolase family 18 protein, partial [Polychaeton citri CBS 116435]